jgi:hypothetical protein
MEPNVFSFTPVAKGNIPGHLNESMVLLAYRLLAQEISLEL